MTVVVYAVERRLKIMQRADRASGVTCCAAALSEHIGRDTQYGR